MRLVSVAVLLGMLAAVAAFGSSDDRFLKKYAMMKIYESCFGAEVVKEIRQEMKAACAKCAAPEMQQNAVPQIFTGRIPPSFVQGMNNNAPPYMNIGEASQDANQNSDNSLGQQVATSVPATPDQPPPLDTEKLQQAIFSIRIPQPLQNYPVPNYAFRAPFGAVPYQQQGPFQQQAYPQQLPFQQQSPYSQQPSLYPQPQAYMQPWGAQPFSGAFPAGFVQPYQFYGNRASREMDFRNRLELLTSRANGKVRNVTCVMQELGYLDQNLEPNYEKISERIANLPVSKELKSDIQDGLQFCQQFAQCVPETKKENSPLSRELLKPMFFFRCYKHKKLEACIMKDVRDRFGSEDELDTDTDFRSISRAGRAMKNDAAGSEQTSDSSEEMAAAMYDFLYGSHDSESDAFL